MSLGPGVRLGLFEVTGSLGAGGMGEVYRARDTRLQRDVALKILPELFAADPDRLARFEREAQVLASLNHPHIAAIYGLEESEGIRALVLELVEGETLAERILRGTGAKGAESGSSAARLTVDEVLTIARQVADALDAAHERGIIHRDLKPANIKITPEGVVKVLDFGLAKLVDAPSEAGRRAGDLTVSPTLTVAMATGVGTILGTAAYMAPEQARGRPADRRSDIWAFGCVLYEMLTGRRTFEGSDVTDMIASVLKSEPDWTALPADTPPIVRTVLARCLKKDPKERLRDIGDLQLALAGAFESGIRAPVVGDVSPSLRRVLPWAAAVLVCSGLAAAAAWFIARGAEPSSLTTRFTITLPASDRLPPASGGLVSVSPDGRTVLYTAQRDGIFRLFVRTIDSFDTTTIGDANPSETAAFSPDGQWVVFRLGTSLRRVPVAGGPSQELAVVPSGFRGATWSNDDTIVLGLGSAGLASVPAAGGTLTTLARPTDGRLYWAPQMLPNGRALLFTATEQRPDGGEVKTLVLATGEQRTIVPGSAGLFLSTGHLVFVRGGSLWAVGFDADRLELRGTPVPVVEGIRVEPGGAVQMAVTGGGSLVYLPGDSSAGLRLAWIEREGKEERLDTPPRLYRYPRLSPDGSQVAVQINDQDNDIWVWHLARKTLTRLTFDAAADTYPGWTPDGRRLLFSSPRDKVNAPYQQSADGTGSPERVVTYSTPLDQASVSHDGKFVVMRAITNAGEDIVTADLTAKGQVRPLIQTKFLERNAELSPDDRWLAYESNESGSFEVYVRPFPDVDRGRWQVSERGGTRPLWARNGRELFYVAPDGRVVSVPILTGAAFTFGSGVRLPVTVNNAGAGRNYDVSPDGRRFLAVGADAQDRAEIHVVVNWFDELRRRVPVR